MLDDISVERKIYLRELASRIKGYIKRRYNQTISHDEYVETSLYYCRSKFQENLTPNEKAYFSLHVIVPDDINYYNTCQNNKMPLEECKSCASIDRYNFEKIAKVYGIPQNIAMLRYKVMLDNFKNEIIDKEKINIKK